MKGAWFAFVVCSCVILAVSALHFSDEHNLDLKARSRRSPHRGGPGKGRHGPHHVCCEIEENAENKAKKEQMDQYMNECFQEAKGNSTSDDPATSPPPPGMHKMDFKCFSECMLKKANALNDNGNIELEAMKTFAKEQLPLLEAQKTAVDDAVTKCATISSQNSKIDNLTSKCGSTAAKFNKCLGKEIENACPEEKQKKTPECNRMRAHLNESSDAGQPDDQNEMQ